MSDDDSNSSCWWWLVAIIFLAIVESIDFEVIIAIAVISVPFIIIYYLIKRNKSGEDTGTVFHPSYINNSVYEEMKSDDLKTETVDSKIEDDTYEIKDEIVEESISKTEHHLLLIEVKKQNGDPVGNARVRIESKQDFSDEKICDIDGKVIFPKLEEGDYEINIVADGFAEMNKSASINKKTNLEIELEEYAKLELTVHDDVLKSHIKHAIVEVDGKKYDSDENGIANIKDLLAGEVSINVSKELYFDKEIQYSIEDNDGKLSVYLKPNISLDSKYIDIRNELEESMSKTFNRLPTSIDFFLPNYYKKVLILVLEMFESIAINPVYKQVNNFDEKMDQLYNSVKKMYSEVDVTITSTDMIDDFIAIGKQDASILQDIGVTHGSYSNYIESYMNDSDGFIGLYKNEIEAKLQKVDQEITKNFRTYMISPIVGLWTISNKFVRSQSESSTENAAALLLGNILLDATSKMFEIEDITKRLKQQ